MNRIITGGLKEIIVKESAEIPFVCHYCGNKYNSNNHLPENHYCVGLLEVYLCRGNERTKISKKTISEIVVFDKDYYIEFQRR